MVCGVYIEKGPGLVVPGFIPDTLGEIYEYLPSKPEIVITIGVWAMGALLFTLLTKFSIPLYLRHKELNTGDGVK
jgi:molybdopterin-containing oxidoreductase family membrane subunit